jgi:hypothetical protein
MRELLMGRLFAALGLAVAFASAASAQGYTINTPGQPPTFVNPSGNGGYVVSTPGRQPTFVNPTGNGGYVAQTPGQNPTFINPTGGGTGINAPQQPGGLNGQHCYGMYCR